MDGCRLNVRENSQIFLVPLLDNPLPKYDFEEGFSHAHLHEQLLR